MATLLRFWARSLSSAAGESTTGHDKLNNTELNQREYKQPAHPIVDRIIRVNQAGERAAVMIYAGQSAILGKDEDGDCIQVTSETKVSVVASFLCIICCT